MTREVARRVFYVEHDGRRRYFADLAAAIRYTGAFERATGAILGIRRVEP